MPMPAVRENIPGREQPVVAAQVHPAAYCDRFTDQAGAELPRRHRRDRVGEEDPDVRANTSPRHLQRGRGPRHERPSGRPTRQAKQRPSSVTQRVRGRTPVGRTNAVDTHTRNRPDRAAHPRGTHPARLRGEPRASSSTDGWHGHGPPRPPLSMIVGSGVAEASTPHSTTPHSGEDSLVAANASIWLLRISRTPLS